MAHASWGRSLADDTEALMPSCRAGDDANPQNARRPHVREIVYDRAAERLGETMPSAVPAHLRDPNRPEKVSLRPVGGGLEWDTDLEHIRFLDAPGSGS